MADNDSQYKKKRRRSRNSTALTVIAAAVGIGVLYYGRQALIPVVLALLVSLLLSRLVEGLKKYLHVPRLIGAALILSLLVTGIGAGANALWEPAQDWLAAAPRTLATIERKLRPIEAFIRRVDSVTERAGKIANPVQSNNTVSAVPAPVGGAGVLEETRAIAINAVTVLVLSLLLLGGGAPMTARICTAFIDESRVNEVFSAIEAVRNGIAHYYGVIALINLGLGIVTALAMMLLGMPNPILWGTMAAVLNFIPYAGSATTLVVLTVVALVSFNDVGQIVAVPACYLALATIEGQIVQPLLLGRQLELNPVLVFLALWFGGWIWGIAGIALAVPILVSIKIAAEHHRHGAALVAFLSPSAAGPLRPFRERVAKTKVPFRRPAIGRPE